MDKRDREAGIVITCGVAGQTQWLMGQVVRVKLDQCSIPLLRFIMTRMVIRNTEYTPVM
jgi:hypothetical protein